MRRYLSYEERNYYSGGAITPTVLLAYLMVAAGCAGIYKILKSNSGRLSITGITFQWSK